MAGSAASAIILRETGGAPMAVYGPFALRTAFQPIFRRANGGRLRLEAFEGLVRPQKSGAQTSPFAFFSAVEQRDRDLVDAACRRLHLCSFAVLGRRDASLFLNFDPSHFVDTDSMRREALEVVRLAEEINLPPSRIVCEITEKMASNRQCLVAVVEAFREHGFRVAVDDYGAEHSDIARIALLQPDIVKVDRDWLLRYMEHGPGIELLRDTIARFQDNRITTLFEGLEENWQVDLSLDLGVDLLQGYALARPEMLPTRFNDLFPEETDSAAPPAGRLLSQRSENPPEAARATEPPQPLAPARARPAGPQPRPVFGRRGR